MSAVDTTSTATENYYVSSREEKKTADDTRSASEKGYVSHDDFLKLLTTQLTHQDPLNPMEDTDFSGQLAQLQALDEQVAMTKAMAALRTESQLSGASSLIGKFVTGADKYNISTEGIVEKAIMRDGEVFLQLKNMQQIPFGNVTDIRESKATDVEVSYKPTNFTITNTGTTTPEFTWDTVAEAESYHLKVFDLTTNKMAYDGPTPANTYMGMSFFNVPESSELVTGHTYRAWVAPVVEEEELEASDRILFTID